jgi:hypothetical protein
LPLDEEKRWREKKEGKGLLMQIDKTYNNVEILISVIVSGNIIPATEAKKGKRDR